MKLNGKENIDSIGWERVSPLFYPLNVVGTVSHGAGDSEREDRKIAGVKLEGEGTRNEKGRNWE